MIHSSGCNVSVLSLLPNLGFLVPFLLLLKSIHQRSPKYTGGHKKKLGFLPSCSKGKHVPGEPCHFSNSVRAGHQKGVCVWGDRGLSPDGLRGKIMSKVWAEIGQNL